MEKQSGPGVDSGCLARTGHAHTERPTGRQSCRLAVLGYKQASLGSALALVRVRVGLGWAGVGFGFGFEFRFGFRLSVFGLLTCFMLVYKVSTVRMRMLVCVCV